MGPWGWAYLLGTYASALICVYAAIKIGRQNGLKAGLVQVGILVFFVVAYYLLESMAHVSAPFYGYPDIFPDMLPYFDWRLFGIASPPGVGEHACSIHTGDMDRITLSVPVLEASVTYALMWTTRLLVGKNRWTHSHTATMIAPFMAGLVALALDGFLDPIVSQSFNCDAVPGLVHPGLGFWLWYAEADLAHFWFGIPAFNYAAWYAAPVILITFVLIASWLWDWILYVLKLSNEKPHAAHFLVRLVIFLVFLTLHLTAPGEEAPTVQVFVILFAIVVSLFVVWTHRHSYTHNNPIHWEFALPLIFFFSLPLFILLLSGVFSGFLWPWLLPLSIGLAVVGITSTFSPYLRWLHQSGP